MRNYASMLPSTDALKKGLTWALRAEMLDGHSVILLDRELSPYSASFPCEVVTCQIGKGRPLQLFCKYTAGVEYTGHGHRGRVEHEIAVYREILAQSRYFRPKLYGSYADPETGDHWLFLEYLDSSLRIQKVGLHGLPKAARWIARFHAVNERLAMDKRLQFLKRYDRNYYLGWVRRTSEFAGSLHRRYPWLHALCERSEKLLAPLLRSSPTVIHGEYYPNNVLYHRGRVCPVDWESAAIADGLIDLAALTEGSWPEEVVQACTKRYQRTRWPGGIPPEFKFNETLIAASLYVCFRWLGDEPSATHGKAQRYFRHLWSLGRQLGVF
jgi:Phosphotransferase enzyme family